MVRRSTPNSRKAQRWFPVRIRVAVPPEGFGYRLDHMRAWLDASVGHERYAWGTESDAGVQDSMVLHFMDARDAAAFVDRFGCGMALLKNPTPENRPW